MSFLNENNNASMEEVQNYRNGRTACNRRHFFAKKIHKLTKMLKPMARLMSRCSAVAPAPLAEDHPSPEDIQNTINEALENRLQEDMAFSAGVKGDAIQSLSGGGAVTLITVVPGLLVPIPASFLSASPGRFSWVQIPAPDSDICSRGDSQPFTLDQVPQQQTPVSV